MSGGKLTAERLPCGCVVETVGETFVMRPCEPGCEFYRYALDQSKRLGMPTQMVVDPETDERDVAKVLREYGFGRHEA